MLLENPDTKSETSDRLGKLGNRRIAIPLRLRSRHPDQDGGRQDNHHQLPIDHLRAFSLHRSGPPERVARGVRRTSEVPNRLRGDGRWRSDNYQHIGYRLDAQAQSRNYGCLPMKGRLAGDIFHLPRS